MMHGEANIR